MWNNMVLIILVMYVSILHESELLTDISSLEYFPLPPPHFLRSLWKEMLRVKAVGVERRTRPRAILRPPELVAASAKQANPPKAREKEMRQRYKFYILPVVADICHRYSHHHRELLLRLCVVL